MTSGTNRRAAPQVMWWWIRERGSGGRAGEREREQRWPRGEEQQGFVLERCWVKTMLGPALDGVGAGGGALGGGSRLEEELQPWRLRSCSPSFLPTPHPIYFRFVHAVNSVL
jgi:hypothetical protein